MKTIPIAITYDTEISKDIKRVLLFEDELDDFISFFRDYAEDITKDVSILEKEMKDWIYVQNDKAFVFFIIKIEQTIFNPTSFLPEKRFKYKLDDKFIHSKIFRENENITKYKDIIVTLPELIKLTYESDGSIYPTPPTPFTIMEKIHQNDLNQELNQLLQKYNLSDL